MEQQSVKEMIHLLEKKNSYLMDFQNLNTEELHRVQQENYKNLEAFYYDRELLLNAMDRIDKLLAKYSFDQCEEAGASAKEKILTLLHNKRKSLQNIVKQDIQLYEALNSSIMAEKDKSA